MPAAGGEADGVRQPAGVGGDVPEERLHRRSLSRDFKKLLTEANFEPREVNFGDLCRQFYPEKKPSELTCQEQVTLIRYALRKRESFLIDPHSTFVKYFDLVITVALVFTGVVTPYEVIFVKTVAATDWLFFVNRIVDLIFVVDIASQFFLKVPVRQPGKRGTVLLKDRQRIRRMYMTSWFPIDIIGILPFDIVFLVWDGADHYSGVKILRCVRLLRLVKLVRILRSSRLILRWQSYLGASFRSQKLAKFSVVLLMSSHWMACVWGFTGLTLGANLCDANGFQIKGLEIPPEDVSWVTALYADSGSPDSPCNPWHIYSASLHWSVMTITSIGYGDISPSRNAEYLVCVLCMLAGGILWAYTIGCLCSFMSNGDPVEAEFESNSDLLNNMMQESNVDESKRQSYREFLRESRVFDSMTHFRDIASKFSPKLKGELLLCTCRSWSRAVFYLSTAPDRILMALAETMAVHFYSKDEEIHEQSLCLVEQGTVASAGRILTPGDAFNIDCIVSEKIWRRFPRTVSLTYSMVMALDPEQLIEVCGRDPAVETALRRAAARIAVMRAMANCAQRAKSMADDSAERPSLSEVFDIIVQEAEDKEMQEAPGARAVMRATIRAMNSTSSLDDVNSLLPLHPSPPLHPSTSPAPALPHSTLAANTLVNRASVSFVPDEADLGLDTEMFKALEQRLDLMQEQMQDQFREVRSLLRQAAVRETSIAV